MTIDRAVEKFDNLLKDVNKIMPLTVLKDGTVCYYNYVVRKNKIGLWECSQVGKKLKNNVGTFYLRSSAILAANHHKHSRVGDLELTKNMDQRYWSNYIDSLNFNSLYKKTNDEVKRDVFLWRWEQCRDRADYYRDEITYRFSHLFR